MIYSHLLISNVTCVHTGCESALHFLVLSCISPFSWGIQPPLQPPKQHRLCFIAVYIHLVKEPSAPHYGLQNNPGALRLSCHFSSFLKEFTSWFSIRTLSITLKNFSICLDDPFGALPLWYLTSFFNAISSAPHLELIPRTWNYLTCSFSPLHTQASYFPATTI